MNKKTIRNAILAAPIAAAITLGGATTAFAAETPAVSPAATTQVNASAVKSTGATEAQRTTIFDSINAYRASLGVNPVQYNTPLSQDAQSWSNNMANTNDVNYNYNINKTAQKGYTNWTQLVGANSEPGNAGAQRLANNWINNPQYNSIVSDPSWTHVGIGVTNPSDPGFNENTGNLVYNTYGNITFWSYPDGTPVEGTYKTVADAYAAPVTPAPAPTKPAPAPVTPAPTGPIAHAPEVNNPAPVVGAPVAQVPVDTSLNNTPVASTPEASGPIAHTPEVGTPAEVITPVAKTAPVAPAVAAPATDVKTSVAVATKAPAAPVAKTSTPETAAPTAVADAKQDVLADTGVSSNSILAAFTGVLLFAGGVVFLRNNKKKVA